MLESFLRSLEAGWHFLLLISNGPLGVYTVLAALIAAGGSVPILKRAAAAIDHEDTRVLIVDCTSVAIAVAVAWVPMRNLNGLMIGLIAGLASPYFWRAFTAVAKLGYLWAYRRVKP